MNLLRNSSEGSPCVLNLEAYRILIAKGGILPILAIDQRLLRTLRVDHSTVPRALSGPKIHAYLYELAVFRSLRLVCQLNRWAVSCQIRLTQATLREFRWVCQAGTWHSIIPLIFRT